MSIYIIGDIHGHLTELEQLLLKINFCSQDKLWFTGDLINGGPQSLETIKFVKSLEKQVVCVLGNHEIILMAAAYNHRLLNKITDQSNKSNKSINGILEVLNDKNSVELINWLEQNPLAYFEQNINLLLVHAGVHPDWTLTKTLDLAQEVSLMLQGSDKFELYNNIYGDHPNNWNDHLVSWDRIRCIINYFTRMRFCTLNGQLDFQSKGEAHNPPKGYMPWYKIEHRKTKDTTIVFGHWSALLGKTYHSNVISVDTGCRWGGKLTAYKVDTKEFFDVPSIVY